MSEDGEAFGLTTFSEDAVRLHEIYLSFRNAGFSEYAAMWMTAALTKGLPIPDWISAQPE